MNNKLHSELIKKAMFPDLGCSEFRELTARKAMRITPMRMMVYHFIRCAEDKGISAYQILDQLNITQMQNQLLFIVLWIIYNRLESL